MRADPKHARMILVTALVALAAPMSGCADDGTDDHEAGIGSSDPGGSPDDGGDGDGGGDGDEDTGGSTGDPDDGGDDGSDDTGGDDGGDPDGGFEPWPVFRHDVQRTGFTSAVGDFTDPPTIRWSQGVGGLVEPSPVVDRILDDQVADVVIGAYGGLYMALDGAAPGPQGASLWTHDTQAEPADFVLGSASLGDLDGDAVPEIVLPAQDGTFVALRANGTNMWTFATGATRRSWSSPAIADVSGDGHPDAVFHADAMYVVDGATGEKVWSAGDCVANVVSSPAVADLNDDGVLDVVGCPSYFEGIKAFDGATGNVLWTSTELGSVEATPAIADLDADGKLEVALGISAKGIVAMEGESGQTAFVFPFEWGTSCTSDALKRIMSSPALGQLDDDPQLEIVEGSNSSCNKGQEPSFMYAVDGKTGQREWRYDANDYIESSPLIADVSPASPGNEILYGDHLSYLVLLSNAGKLLWQLQIPSANCGECKVVSSPALVDVDGSGAAEIVVGTNAGSLLVLAP